MSRTDLFAEIAEVIGLPAAVKLAEARGGTRIMVPAKAGDGHWLVQLLGRETAEQLFAHFREHGPEGVPRGRLVDLPRGPTGSLATARRRMVEALESGVSADRAARMSGMTRRSAFRIKKRIRDPRQGDLF
ncbi:hypothetical protein [Ancylobacter sp. G4_0304]|uniref:hypothetical protein n=1 Tax=Ancylobacter sp. G4_0304 TaxID=3114289 RepID=UPI0039C60E8E